MMRKTLSAMIALALVVPSMAIAHHGWSSYDEAKTITATGPLTELKWGSPHGTAKIIYRKKAWNVVLAPVSRMEARGLTPAMVGPKRSVTLVGYPRRDGTAEMRIERVTAGDKTVELR